MRVVITGAGGGLGREVVQTLLERPDVHVHALVRTIHSHHAPGSRLTLHEVDLVDLPAIDSLEIVGEIDAVIHCAAAGENMSFSDADPDDWNRFFSVNVVAAAALTQRLTAQFAARASVVFVNSGLGLRASGTSVPYSSSKAALKSLADSIRPELNSRGVSVTTIYPGQMATTMLERNVASMGREWEPDDYIQPHDLARLIVDLATSATSIQLTDVVARPLREPW